jgi:hypothetical protein
MQGGGYFAAHQPNLPPGWQMAYTSTGQVYYVDHNSQTTHWQPPQMQSQVPQHVGYGAPGPRGGRGGGFSPRGGRVGIDQAKRKTKMCMNWESGSCSWGDRCAFAHGAVELNPIRHDQGYPNQMMAPVQQMSMQQAPVQQMQQAPVQQMQPAPPPMQQAPQQ